MRLTLVRQMLSSNLRRNAASTSNQTNTTVAANTPSDRLRKIDLSKDMDSLPKAQQMYVKKMIEKNNERWEKDRKLRKHYNISAVILFSIVFSIYFYSMYAVKQEKFLDDFETPQPPDEAVKDFKR